MTWPVYSLIEAANFIPQKRRYRKLRIRERTVLRHGSGEKVLKDRIVVRYCSVFKGKVVLV